MKNNGLPTAGCDPYTSAASGKVGVCPYDCSMGDNSTFRLYYGQDAYIVPVTDDDLKSEVYANGPFEVDMVDFANFQTYKGM